MIFIVKHLLRLIKKENILVLKWLKVIYMLLETNTPKKEKLTKESNA